VKGIEVFFLNKGPGPLQRGGNCKVVKMGWGHLKIFSRTTGPILNRLGTNHPWVEGIQVYINLLKIFSRTTGPILTKLGINHPWGKWIQVSSNEGDCLLQGEIIARE
jgi:hypothetical protein